MPILFFKLTLEQIDFESTNPFNTSEKSRYDYVVWKLMFTGKTAKENPEGVPLIVVETKHSKSLMLKAAGQAIAYYSRSKNAFTGSGVGILLNEHQGNIAFQIILFPFNNAVCGTDEKPQFGSQALLLPEIKQSYDDFMKGDFVKLICAVCSKISEDEFKALNWYFSKV